jgi:hypothetical protein
MSADTMHTHHVAAALRRLGIAEAYDEHTGGGIWCVFLPEPTKPDAEWIFGMADETWGGELLEKASTSPYYELVPFDQRTDILTTAVSSDDTDYTRIAEAILAAIAAWRSL